MGNEKNRGTGKGLRFLHWALTQETDECIDWPYYVSPEGYGQVGDHEGMHLAHRYICQLAHGEPPRPNSQAAHSCKGNKKCVNKRHVRWTDQTGNEDDKHAHGTWWTRISSAKISEELVPVIRKDLETLSIKAVAQKHGVSTHIVRHIKHREAWKHV